MSWAYDPEFGRHQVHDADSALARLGLEGANAGWRGELPEPLLVSGRKALHGAGLDTKAFIVGLAPGVAWGGSAKRWPAEKFGHLARRLRDRGFEPVVVIGPGEAELARSVVEASGIGLPVVAEDLDAAGLGAVLRNLSCLIGNDSGPAHLASVLGVATIALFGPTDDQRTAPMMPEGTVMSRRLDCAPCGQATCPLLHKACLTDLPESDVCDAVADLLEDARPVARVQ